MSSRLGTDVMAMAVIMTSGAVGGVVTLAALQRSGNAGTVECMTTAVMPAPTVAIESSHGHTVVVAPRVRVHAAHGCGSVLVGERVQADLERALSELETTRIQLNEVYPADLQRRLDEEMAKVEAELARLDRDPGR